MLKNFFKDEKGDTNIISIVIILGVIIALVFLFRPYLQSLVSMIFK